ncbi:hypothetical protein ACFYPN_33155 [Streptomyces sp. NPDC005576]|uniref:hypothetical protein n=1 Tax=Streptomyces sp. NPDC005576 TaxID=3364726 RepID=UPI00367B4C33
MTPPLLVDVYAAAAATGIRPGTLRVRLHRGTLTRYGQDRAGRTLIDLNELVDTGMAKVA